MPIKTGSGGLKYQLPSQAQLQAQQAAASASAGGSASASAYGANRRLAGDKMQLRYNAYQADMDRAFRAEQAFYGREHEMGAQLESQAFRADLQYKQRLHETDLQNASQKFRGDQAQLDRDFQGEQARLSREDMAKRELDRDTRQFEQDTARFEMGRDAAIEAKLQSGEYVLDPAAQRQLDKLEAGMADLRDFDLDQQEEYKKKYAEEKRRILRTGAQPRGGPTATGRFQQGITHVDPNTGESFDKPIPGRTRPYDTETKGWVDQEQQNQKQQAKMQQQALQLEQQKKQMEQQQERNKAIADRYEKNKAEIDKETDKPVYADNDEALRAAIEAQDDYERVRKGFGQTQAPPAPGQGAPVAGQVQPIPNAPGTPPVATQIPNAPATPPVVQPLQGPAQQYGEAPGMYGGIYNQPVVRVADDAATAPLPIGAESITDAGMPMTRLLNENNAAVPLPSMNDVAKQKAAVPMPSGIPPQPQTAGGTLTPLPEVAPGLQGGAAQPLPPGLLPTGTPEGAKWVDQETIQTPDMKVYRRRRKPEYTTGGGF